MGVKQTDKMPEAATSEQRDPAINIVVAGRLFLEIAVIVNNTIKHYWLSQKDAEADIARCYKSLASLLESCPLLVVRIVVGVPSINGISLSSKDAVLEAFFTHLIVLGVDNFYIAAGVTLAEFRTFCNILCARPREFEQAGGFAAVMDKIALKYITTRKLVVREIADTEIVIAKDELAKTKGEGGGGAASVGDILAFLKGDVMARDESAAVSVRETASDPQRMAELILQAAEVRQRADLEGGETLGEFIVGCLRRTHQEMARDPAAKTVAAKKKAGRNFLLLEETVLKRMREMGAGVCAESDLSAVAAGADEIRIDSIAEEYVGKVASLRESEHRLVDFMRQENLSVAAAAVIPRKFAERGISVPGWRSLVVKGGDGGGMPSFSNAHIEKAISHLDTLLDHMEKEFSKMSKVQKDEGSRKMWEVLAEVDREIQKLTAHTGVTIGRLVTTVLAEEPAVAAVESSAIRAGRVITLTRKQVLGMIGAILRDVAEPLELIRTALGMLTSKTFGSNAEVQSNVLKIVSDNADLIKTLLESLKTISPEPPVARKS